ncbi:hypothetical protein [Mycolicibacterium fortuitum]|uniref:hypothetical protein n=1 Tax=Mycolicibacterium fortuitum TaxID=1766 RepID=UPI003AABDCBC
MNDDSPVVDLDQPKPAAAEPEPTECSCGARRTLLRHWELTPCPSRALSRLRRAHPDEYATYLAEEKQSALDVFEEKWRRHLAGDHGTG